MTVIAFIFARGGSKGIPKKNVKKLMGKPLIAWSIEHAHAVSKIDRIIVSTDSTEIADIAVSYGAEVPFLRPLELASDTSPEWLSWKHALQYLKDTDGILPDTMVSVPTTAPLRKPIDIENCIDKFIQNNVDVVISVTDAHRSPYFNMVSMNSLGHAELVIKPNKQLSRRQDVPKVFDITTVCYVANPIFVLNHNSIFDGKVGTVHVPLERSIDIDSPFDFFLAECILGSGD